MGRDVRFASPLYLDIATIINCQFPLGMGRDVRFALPLYLDIATLFSKQVYE